MAKMWTLINFLLLIWFNNVAICDQIYETDVNFRIEAGTTACFFEKGEAGQMMELYYQVIDGQHGDLDISVDVFDPRGIKLISDYKKTQNSIIMELEYAGDYVFCLDNTYSLINSKLVFVYVVIEDKKTGAETEVSVVDSEGQEHEAEVLEWVGVDQNGDTYTIEVTQIADSLMRTLTYVVRARHMLGMYSASKSRDSYIATEDTFVVDMWSAFQVTFMMCVGFLQVYMIKQLFRQSCTTHINY